MESIKPQTVFVYVSHRGHPWASSANSYRRDVIRWADEHLSYLGGSKRMKRDGWRIVKMMLVPIPTEAVFRSSRHPGKEGGE